MVRKTGRFDFEIRALEPLHHGAGSVGNTQVFRVQRIWSETVGAMVRVPFISGNSIKHMVRDGAARFCLDAMEIEDRSLSKPVVHLLFSGGSLTKKSKSVRLDLLRELEDKFPALSLCGYSAGNVMAPSKVKVDHLHLVCLENQWRMPESFLGREEAKHRAGEFREESFGTRHEPTRAIAEARRIVLADIVAKEDEPTAKKNSESVQMIYDFEVISAGSLWWGCLWFDELTELELLALKSALAYMSRGKSGSKIKLFVWAKSSVGYGRAVANLGSSLRLADDSSYSPI
ncbi:MAG: hypothetical protein ACWGQW_18620, partial [bacterium]